MHNLAEKDITLSTACFLLYSI